MSARPTLYKRRPVCVHCGQAYGKRDLKTETVRWAFGDEPPAYRGNGVVVREKMRREAQPDLVTPESSREQGHWQAARAAREPIDQRGLLYREVWDGESWWGGYNPFCTLRCALSYARKAYAKGGGR